MSTSINVGKATVAEFLKSGASSQFIIPVFQRTYDWEEDQIRALFDDIWNFTVNEGGPKREASYFLGCIVLYEDIDDNQQPKPKLAQMVIDGQQRLTSLFLLLRAIYTKLSNSKDQEDDIVSNLKRQIEQIIWKVSDPLRGIVDYEHPLLVSRAVSESNNQILLDILRTGELSSQKDNYSHNYKTFISLYEEHSKEDPLLIFNFIHALLHQTIVLPIKADSIDTALKIFETLNDRGKPLSDADIFKANIYSHLKDEEAQDEFIKSWITLNERTEAEEEAITNLFAYYMFNLRAQNKDSNNSTVGLRSYYLSQDGKDKLYAPDLLDKLGQILDIISVFKNHKIINGEPWSENTEILQALDVLRLYPNEWWKYPVIIYYLAHKHEETFEGNFLIFLRKLCVELIIRYIEYPTLYGVKNSILKLDIEILGSQTPKIEFAKEKSIADLSADIINPENLKVQRMLLALLAYQHPDQLRLLPDKWEIEHILPQKWQNNYFFDLPDKEVRARIEHIGNKSAIEKKTNISAGNGYFAKKKEAYKKSSKIAAVLDLASRESADWTLEDIEKRDREVSALLIQTFTEWDEKYRQARS